MCLRSSKAGPVLGAVPRREIACEQHAQDAGEKDPVLAANADTAHLIHASPCRTKMAILAAGEARA